MQAEKSARIPSTLFLFLGGDLRSRELEPALAGTRVPGAVVSRVRTFYKIGSVLVAEVVFHRGSASSHHSTGPERGRCTGRWLL